MNTHSGSNPHSERLARLFFLLLLGGIALLVFGPAGDDDGHITYTAAKHLAETGRISNHNGEWVEQGSSLLHVLSLGAVLGLLGLFSNSVDVAALGPVYSLFFALLCLPLSLSLAQRLRLRQPMHAAMLLSVSTAVTYWATGGLEATLAACCFMYFLFAVFHFIRHHQPHYLDGHLLLATSLFLLVRPEAFFVLLLFLALFAGLLLMQGKQAMLNRIGIMAAYTVALFALLCVIRLYFYGQLFPQPVYAKAAGLSPLKIAIGLYYFIYSAQLSIIVYTVLLWGIFRQRLLVSPQVLAAFSLCVAYLTFIVVSGGDWMAGGRFFVPVLPIMIVLALYVLQHHRHYHKLLAALVTLCVLEITFFSFKLAAGLPPNQAQEFRNRYPEINWHGYAWTETDNLVHARDIPVINALNDIIDALPAQQKPHVIASIQMGMVPFHLRQRYHDKVYIVDMRGLSTRHLSDCPPLAAAPKTWSGIAISYHDYFMAMAECRLPQPDIIYDLLNREAEVNADRLDSIQRQGYTIVYRQQGRFMPAHGLKSVDADTFIAVSPAIYSLLPEHLRMRHPQFGQGAVLP